MRIDVLSKSTVKVTMTAEDMSEYDIVYEQLTKKTAESRKIIAGLLSDLQHERRIFSSDENIAGDFFLDERHFFIEAFPRMDGGCMLYISSLSENRKKRFVDILAPENPTASILCETDAENLGALGRALLNARTLEKADFESRLLQGEKNWCLVLMPKAACISRLEEISSEFGRMIKDETDIAAVCERCREVISADAAEKLAEWM